MPFHPRKTPYWWFGAWAVGGTAAVTVGLAWGLGWLVWVGYLIGVNVVTAALYGYDKWAAPRQWARTPEMVLHGCALAGGTPAAFACQRWLRHKSAHRGFLAVSWVIFAAQVVGAAALWWYWPRTAAPAAPAPQASAARTSIVQAKAVQSDEAEEKSPAISCFPPDADLVRLPRVWYIESRQLC